MSKKSDALTALVREVADIERELEHRNREKDTASTQMTAARQVLDSATDRVNQTVIRLNRTTEALGLISTRDDVSEETVKALVERARDQ